MPQKVTAMTAVWDDDGYREGNLVPIEYTLRETYKASGDDTKQYDGMPFELVAVHDRAEPEMDECYAPMFEIKVGDAVVWAFPDEVAE